MRKRQRKKNRKRSGWPPSILDRDMRFDCCEPAKMIRLEVSPPDPVAVAAAEAALGPDATVEDRLFAAIGFRRVATYRPAK